MPARLDFDFQRLNELVIRVRTTDSRVYLGSSLSQHGRQSVGVNVVRRLAEPFAYHLLSLAAIQSTRSLCYHVRLCLYPKAAWVRHSLRECVPGEIEDKLKVFDAGDPVGVRVARKVPTAERGCRNSDGLVPEPVAS